nr:uncharacterized protein LOC109176597 [Ipomoea batatas]
MNNRLRGRTRFTQDELRERKRNKNKDAWKKLSQQNQIGETSNNHSNASVDDQMAISSACALQNDAENTFMLSAIPDCIYCGAKRLQYEPPGFCCCKGEVVLVANGMPPTLKALYTSPDKSYNNFRSCVRTYNNTFAFTSLGIHNYEKDLCRRNKGIYTFKVQGQIYHFINDLLPDGCPPRNLQLYFYDTDHEVENRVSEVGHLDEKIVSDLIEVMSHNPYAKFFRSLKDLVHSDEFSISLQSCPSLDQRIYNAPTTSQVAAVWIEDFEGSGDNRNIRVYAHSGRAQNIQYYYGCYDPLQYPLLFPFGDAGWHEGIERVFPNNTSTRNTYASALYINANDVSNVEELLQAEEAVFREGKKRRSVSCREYYAYKFQMRSGDTSLLLHTGRLFQQFIVDIYIKVETQRLDYFRKKQQLCRSENFQGLVDSVGTGAVFGNDVGRRVILPSSFIGGPRDMRGRYMDAMSLVQNFGKPDFFLTITCNPNWPEIKRLLEFNDEAQNRPDLVARVFHAKLQELKNDITKKTFLW